MSQSDVIEYLEKYGEGSPDEMSKVLGIGQSSMSFNVNRCAKSGDIVLKEKFRLEGTGIIYGNYRRNIKTHNGRILTLFLRRLYICR